MQSRSKIWPPSAARLSALGWQLAGAWILLVGGYAVASLALPRGRALTAVGDIGQCLAAAFAAFGFALSSASLQKRINIFWMLLSLGCASWLAGQILWTYFEVVLRQPVPNPFLGDVILFLHSVPMIGALAAQPHDHRADLNVRLGYLDFSLLLLWWVYLYLFVVIPWQYITPNVALYGNSYDQLEGIENLILAVGMGVLLLRARDKWRLIYGHLCGAALLFAVGVYLTNLAIDRGDYYTGSAYDLPLVAALVWFGTTGVLAQGLASSGESTPVRPRDASLWPSRFAMAAVLSMPALALWSLWGSRAPREVRDFRVAVTQAAILVVALLMLLRQRMVDYDRLCLLRSSQNSFENLKLLQAQLIQSEKLASLGQLSAGAAHEINNPLTGILGYADLLADDGTLDEKSRASAEKVRTLARRIKQLVGSLLSFARQVPGEKTLLDLNQVLSSALHLNNLDLRGKRIHIDVQAEGPLPMILGDANQMLQVFFNIMNNAIDAMEEVGGGQLTIRTRSAQPKVIVEFSDTGAGISAPHLVFDPFFTTKPVGKGTGLGLSICYGILQEHGGRISCYNRPEGGATFVVELPAVLATSPKKDEAPQHAAQTS